MRVRYGLSPDSEPKLRCLAGRLLSPEAPSAINTPQAVLNDHLADALVALESGSLNSPQTVLDLGSGPGVPGLPLAIAMPGASFTLLEASLPKVRFLTRLVDDCRIAGVDIVHSRAEAFAAAGRRYDVVTARAVGPLSVVLEYAAPLLRLRGTLIVWRGRREPAAETSARRVAEELGLGTPSIVAVEPYPGAQHRHLYVVSKEGETPPRFPRRPGVALKRPLGGASTSRRASSDRAQR